MVASATNQTGNMTSFDPKVRKTVMDYHRLDQAQKSQFQQALLSNPEDNFVNTTPDEVKTWADVGTQLGPLEWEWEGWLAKGYLTILASESGVGKSQLMLRIAQVYIQGKPWPDGSEYKGGIGAVLWCEAEAAQGLNFERAKRWGIPLDLIYTPLVDPLADINLELPEHRESIRALAERPEVRCVIVDSLRGSHRGNEDTSEVIGIVMWLAELARDTGKPVIVSHHLRKKGLNDTAEITLDRLRGSSAIVQPARIVWALDVPDPSNKEAKRLNVIKSNLGKFPDPIGLTISEAGIAFGVAPKPPKRETVADKARELFSSLLNKRPLPSTEVEAAFEAHSISKRTMNKVKKDMGIVSEKENNPNGRWMMSLPAKIAA